MGQTQIVSAGDRLGIMSCTLKEAREVVELCIRCKHPVCLVGDTGIGKTHLIRQIAQSTGSFLKVIFLAHREREDLVGIPFPDSEGRGYYSFLPEESVYSLFQHKEPVILLLDEYNRADKAVMNAAFTMMEDRMFGSIKLPDNVSIVACMNPSDEQYNVNSAEKDPAFRRRMCFVHVQLDHSVWVDYAFNVGKFHHKVVSFIRNKPQFLSDPATRESGKAAPTPASWEKVSDTMLALDEQKVNYADEHILDILRVKTAGHVGTAATVQFLRHVLRNDDSIAPEDIAFHYTKVEPLIKKIVKSDDGKTDNAQLMEITEAFMLYLFTEQVDPAKIVVNFVKFLGDITPECRRAAFAKINKHAETLGRSDYRARLSTACSKLPAYQTVIRSLHCDEKDINEERAAANKKTKSGEDD